MRTAHFNSSSDIFVLYHGPNCMDGMGARFAAWHKFGDNANYIPVDYGEELLRPVLSGSEEELSKREVYILDFSYPKEILEDIHSKVGKLMVLDHHKTAKEQLDGLPYAIFDMDKSGAVMAWEYFNPDQDVPRLLKHIEDRDLWRFKLSGTKEILAAFDLRCDDEDEWTYATPEDSISSLSELYYEGKVLQKAVDAEVKRYVETKVRYMLLNDKYKVSLVNTTSNISEIGNYICKNKDVDFSISYFINEEGLVVLSFRSTDDLEDVGAIAKSLGGGGHRNAAGARISLSDLERLISEQKLG